MMEDVEVGSKIEISIQGSESLENEQYKSTILQVLDDDSFLISLIKKGRNTIKLPINRDYMFTVYTDKGTCQYTGKILDYTHDQSLLKDCILIKFEQAAAKVQRRENFRSTCEIPMTYRLSREIVTTSFEKNEGLIIDISAGGIKFLTDVYLNKGERIDVELFLADEVFFLEAIVMYIDELSEQRYSYQYRCKFDDALDKDKDKIIQYVLDEQRNSLKKRRFN